MPLLFNLVGKQHNLIMKTFSLWSSDVKLMLQAPTGQVVFIDHQDVTKTVGLIAHGYSAIDFR